MKKLFSGLIVLFLVLSLFSCGILTGDKFVYLGHGEETPDYQLYYDKTRKLFVLIDKKNGCFQKDDTGTCIALTLKQAREFRKKALAKMIDIDIKLAKDDYGNYAVSELEKAGITTVKKPIDIGTIYATPIKQIVLDRRKQYHIVKDQYKLDANLIAMVSKGNDGGKFIKVAYTIDFPGIVNRDSTNLKPFILDPEYMYTHMTMDAVHQAQFMQKDVIKTQKNVTKEVKDYLSTVVDAENKDKQVCTDENMKKKIASLGDADTRVDSENVDSIC